MFFSDVCNYKSKQMSYVYKTRDNLICTQYTTLKVQDNVGM